VTVIRPAFARDGVSATARDGVALTVGRVQPWKGPDVLCRALRKVPADACPTVRWVGRSTRTAEDGSSLEAHLRQQYPDVWGTRVDWVGPRPFDEVAVLVSRAPFVVVPSTWDVFNFTAVEAMAAGAVVVCSRGAGASDLISSGEDGLLCDPDDDTSLAEGILTAARLPAGDAARIGNAAQETIRRELDPDRSAAAHAQRYRDARASGARPPDWIRQFYSPDAHARGSLAFLDQMSISSVAAYLGGRLRRRLGDGGRSEPA
jgi:glycosyltransferase involved in cell wall biosynthesis